MMKNNYRIYNAYKKLYHIADDITISEGTFSDLYNIYVQLPEEEKDLIGSGDYLDEGHEAIYIAAVNNKPIGYIELTEHYKYLYISIAILPEYRSMGIANKLLDNAQSFYNNHIDEYNGIVYSADKYNEVSNKFILKNEDFIFDNCDDNIYNVYVYKASANTSKKTNR